MKIINTEEYDIKNPVVTIGSFDGIHIGHIAILDALKKRALEIGGETVVVTFSPHPRIVLSLDAENLFFLNSMREKIFLLERAGIDNLIILPFTKELAAKTQEEFFLEFLKNRVHTKSLIVGYNHRFGSNRESDYETLCALSEREGIEIVRVEKRGVDERDISSTTIRNLVKRGDMKRVANYLSYPYFFIADVDSTGQVLYYEQKKLYPPQGTYDVEVVDNKGNRIMTKATITKSNSIILKNIKRGLKEAIIYFN